MDRSCGDLSGRGVDVVYSKIDAMETADLADGVLPIGYVG